ncbi:hypothetical protein POTOM_043115 [Populus tomentosa]|uniref:Uncharacterized protein n=1 Tax=Populus tomentosa TaxID=118781 RepID=A0A8X7YLI4_POPTO|nr:hypothetical protein POTOM_043115 [Populus tomentosa]
MCILAVIEGALRMSRSGYVAYIRDDLMSCLLLAKCLLREEACVSQMKYPSSPKGGYSFGVTAVLHC